MHATDQTNDVPSSGVRPTLVKNASSSHFTAVDLPTRRVLADVGDGAYPHTAHYHLSHDVAYLLYITSGHLEVVDLDTLETIQRIDDVGTTPVGSTLGDAGAYFFVGTAIATPTSDSPGVVALEVQGDGTLEIVGDAPIGRCSGMRTGPNGRLLVGQKRAGELAVLDADDELDVQTRIDVGENPHDLYVLPDRELLAVNNAETSHATFVDLANDAVQCRAQTGMNPHGFAVAEGPDYSYALFPARDDEHFAIVDLDAVSVGDDDPTIERLDVGTSTGFAATTTDGRYALVDSYDHERVTIVDLATRTVAARIHVPGEPLHLVFAPDGSECYVGNMARNELAVLDTTPLADDRPGDVSVTASITGFGDQPSGIFQPNSP